MRRLFPFFILILIALPIRAQTVTPPAEITKPDISTLYRWEAGNIAFILSPAWTLETPETDDATQPIAVTSDEQRIEIRVLPMQTVEERRASLEAALSDIDILPITYAERILFGATTLQIDGVTANRAAFGIGVHGMMPDGRILVAVARAPQTERAALMAAWEAVLSSTAFSAQGDPTPPDFALLWSQNGSQNTPVITDELITSTPIPLETLLIDIAASPELVYTIDTLGAHAYDAGSGFRIADYPFPNPAQPTGIAIDSAGAVHVSDALCRCIQVLRANTWTSLNTTFGGSAPFDIAVIGTTLYAVDRTDDGYELVVITENRTRRFPFESNTEQPPILHPVGDVLYATAPLASLLDATENTALFRLENDGWAFDGFLPALDSSNPAPYTMDNIARIYSAAEDGLNVQHETLIQASMRYDAPPRLIAFAPDNTLYMSDEVGVLSAYTLGRAGRHGDTRLVGDVPVIGRLSETTLVQTWLIEGTAEDRITLSAVGMTQNDALDVALRVFVPDGRELTYNDDQPGVDLVGVFDAQIPDLRLPQTGDYIVQVEWVRGDGAYTLAYTPDRSIVLAEEGATEITGALQEAVPVQRWLFAGRTGETYTLTMFVENGTLDPAIELLRPDGTTLAYNDDAYDPELGINAQITRVALPFDGTYVIEASRFEGIGAYRIVVIRNS